MNHSSKYPFTLYLNFNWNEEGYHSSGEYFQRAAKRLGMPVRKYSGGKKDVVLNIETSGHPFVPGRIATGYYDLDVFLNRAFNMIEFQDKADCLFTSHKPPYDVKGVATYIIPHATDPEWTSKRKKKEFDVTVGGRLDSVYGRRIELLEAMIKRGYKVYVVSRIKTKKYLDELSKGRIIFNCSLTGDVSRRDFDGMALGVLVTDKSKYTDMLGEEGTHFFTYKDEKTLFSVIDALLQDSKKLDKVDRESTKHAHKNHTYDVRLELIYQKLKEVYE